MPGLKGDFRKLKDLRRRMRSLGGRDVRRQLSLELSEDAMELLQKGFESGKDPYGRRWPAPKRRQGQPMMDTGRLRYSWSRRYTSEGFYLNTRTAYASYLQHGTRSLKKRMMFPDDRPSPLWNSRFRTTHKAFVRRKLGVR